MKSRRARWAPETSGGSIGYKRDDHKLTLQRQSCAAERYTMAVVPLNFDPGRGVKSVKYIRPADVYYASECCKRQ